jgi:hypothetical protein
MNFLSDIVKPRKTAANNITLQIREDCCSPSNNYYTSSFFDSNSEYTEQHTPTIAAKKNSGTIRYCRHLFNLEVSTVTYYFLAAIVGS